MCATNSCLLQLANMPTPPLPPPLCLSFLFFSFCSSFFCYLLLLCSYSSSPPSLASTSSLSPLLPPPPLPQVLFPVSTLLSYLSSLTSAVQLATNMSVSYICNLTTHTVNTLLEPQSRMLCVKQRRDTAALCTACCSHVLSSPGVAAPSAGT